MVASSASHDAQRLNLHPLFIEPNASLHRNQQSAGVNPHYGRLSASTRRCPRDDTASFRLIPIIPELRDSN